MATTLQAISNTSVKARWEEEYVSEGLNEKTLGTIPGGIIRGGLLEPHPSANRTVRVKDDPTYGDIIASYEDANGRQMTVNLGSGDVDLDLAALAGELVYIAIFVDYSLLADTTAEWRAYTQAQLDGAAEKDRVIIWGTVDVPATAIPLVDADIDQLARREAKWKQSSGLVPWVPIVRNGGFDGGIAHWPSGIGATISASLDDSEYYRGVRSLKATTAGSGSYYKDQEIMFPCEADQLCFLRFVSKASNWTGTVLLSARFYDKDGSYLSSQSVVDTLSSDTHDWEEFSGVVVAPATAAFVRPRITFTASSAGTGAWIDDVQLFVQTDKPNNFQREDTGHVRSDRIYRLRLGDDTDIEPLASPEDFQIHKTASDTLGVDWLGAGTGVLHLDSSLYLEPDNDILPGTTESHDLGSTSARWDEIWGNSLLLHDTTDGPFIEWFDESGVGSYTTNRWRTRAVNGVWNLQALNDAGTGYNLILQVTYDGGLSDWVAQFYRRILAYDIYPIGDSSRTLGTTSIRWLSVYADDVNTHEINVSGGISQGFHDVIPYSSDAYDLGNTSYRWKDLWVTGIARIDELILGTAAGEGLGSHLYPDIDASRRLGYTDVATPDGSNDLMWFEVGAETVRARGNSPELILFDTGETTNEKGWDLYAGGGNFYMAAMNDNETVGGIVFTVLRGTGAIISRMDFHTNLSPIADETYELGSSTYRWNKLYLASDGVDFWDNEVSHGRWEIDTSTTYIYIDSLTDAGAYVDHALFFFKNSSDEVTRAVFSQNSEVEIPSANKTNGLRLLAAYTPASSGESGVAAGHIKWDSSYLYVRVNGTTWKRITLDTFA